MADSEQWGVLVNEAGVNATSRAAEWWAIFWCRYSPIGRITSLGESIAGGWRFVAYDSRDDAEFGRDYMIEQGIARTHVRALTLAAARKAVHRSHVAHRNPSADCQHCDAAAAEPIGAAA